MIRSYKDLDIWKRGVELVKNIYQVTKDFPKSETYALVDQIRRAAISIPSNIAEGHARQHSREFKSYGSRIRTILVYCFRFFGGT